MIPIDDDKVWMKVVYPRRLGGLTKLVEGVTNLGFELNDTNLTTSKGAAILTSCLEVTISKQLGLVGIFLLFCVCPDVNNGLKLIYKQILTKFS